MLGYCWIAVTDGGPTLTQHWLGRYLSMKIRNIGPSLVHKWTYITDVVQTLIQGSRVLWDHFFYTQLASSSIDALSLIRQTNQTLLIFIFSLRSNLLKP